MDELHAVQGTSDDAAVSKLSACLRGYYEDAFIKLFVGKEAKRSPLINRGYFARVKAMDMVIQRFLDGVAAGGAGACQIVALGAGSDTTFFRLRQAGTAPAMYVEVDLENVIEKKLGALKAFPHVRELAGVSLEAVEAAQRNVVACNLQSAHYALACVDLRSVETLAAALAAVEGFSFERPTLFISECVLCYVEPEFSTKLLEWMRPSFPAVAFVTYEQILPHDAFGRTMIAHFKSRGCPLLAIDDYPDTAAQEKRFRALGWEQVEVLDMNDIYYKCLDKAELRRAEKLEIFDEFEEWHMMSAHYCVVLAVQDETPARLMAQVRLLPAGRTPDPAADAAASAHAAAAAHAAARAASSGDSASATAQGAVAEAAAAAAPAAPRTD